MAAEATPTAEEVAADCPYINDYCQKRHKSVVKCGWTQEKGRILMSQTSFARGAIIFREGPLHIVAEHKGNKAFDRLKELCVQHSNVFEYEPLWYWTALSSLKDSQLAPTESRLKPISEDDQRKLLLLYHSEVTEPSEAATMLVSDLGLAPHLDPVDLERLLQIWILNCFEHSDDPLGYSTYFMSSFMSHSCLPNAVWHYEEDDFVLRARCDITDQDEISVSYLSEDALLESVPARRKHLKDSKHFFCTCARCSTELDKSRGFRCPKCSTSNFYRTKSGDSKAPSTELVGATCEECRHQLTAPEAALLVQEEKALETQLEQFERRMEKSGRGKHNNLLQMIEDAVKSASDRLAAHWLLDKSWQLLADLCDRNGRHDDAEDFMRRRIRFQEGAYPGLSGTRAWTLEAYADMILGHGGVTVNPSVKVRIAAATERLAERAMPMYMESLTVLRLMFGDQHEYFTSVNRKVVELSEEFKRLGVPLTAAPEPATVPESTT